MRASLVRQSVRGDWCEAWSNPSRRKRKLARQEGAAPTATYNKTCLWNCNNVGVCDRTTGRCRCRAGWQGTSCEERQDRPCSQRTRPRGSFTPASSEFKFGADWKASMCAGDCDEDIGACFCPSWTKYGRVANNDQREPPKRPGRPMGINCQPNTDEAGDSIPIGNKPYDSLFGPDGWCNARKPAPGNKCPCESGDGLTGENCDIAVTHFCPGQLRGHGTCRQGFLECDEGWTGTDCSIPVPVRDDEPVADTRVHRDRPLIYVYDMPPEFSTRMLEYKMGPGLCSHRLFEDDGSTRWNSREYMVELGLHELMLESSHRTFDPEEADFFYVPVYSACYILPVHAFADRPWFHQTPGSGNRVVGAANMMVEANHWVRTAHPYWNRRGGRDHIILTPHDEGSCWVPEVWRPAVILSHWGLEETPRRRYTSYNGDKFDLADGPLDEIYHPESFAATLGPLDKPCFDRSKDILIPSMVLWDQKFTHSPELLAGSGTTKAKIARDIWAIHVGRTLDWLPEFSNGTRQAMARLCEDSHWWDRHRIYVGEAKDVPQELGGDSYSQLLARSTYCFVLMGEGFTTRFDDAVAHHCVPVIIIDSTLMPFEPQIDVGSFSIRVPVADMARIPEILAAHEDKVEEYRGRIAAVASRYEWRFQRFLASNRTEYFREGMTVSDSRPLDPATKPDAFDTLIGILHDRLEDI